MEQAGCRLHANILHLAGMGFSFVQNIFKFIGLLRLQGVRLTAALEADLGSFEDSIAFLKRADLVKSLTDSRGEILYFDESRET